MKRMGIAAAIAAVVVFLVVPASALAGWAGSRYDQSECTLNVGHDGRPFLYCQTSFVETEVFTDDLTVQDASCPSGQRLIHRVQTVEMTWIVFDYFAGPVPLARFNFAGDEYPTSFRLVSTVETDLGCTT
jgi:hypothetical protein